MLNENNVSFVLKLVVIESLWGRVIKSIFTNIFDKVLLVKSRLILSATFSKPVLTNKSR